MEINEIPLTPTNQQFTIKLSDTVWQFRLIWRDSDTWVLDILTVDNQPVIQATVLNSIFMEQRYDTTHPILGSF
ncbi:phage baseplate plug family protein [Arsenophonus sp. PmNCSU2021_1]|uniref:phage baseplate plug family protein n=1 Tax=Arsenophonus sp. PmNCSU2021_1 TaxID=3118989 RepID=UPI003FA5339A